MWRGSAKSMKNNPYWSTQGYRCCNNVHAFITMKVLKRAGAKMWWLEGVIWVMGHLLKIFLMKTQKDTRICVLFCVSIGTYTLFIKKWTLFFSKMEWILTFMESKTLWVNAGQTTMMMMIFDTENQGIICIQYQWPCRPFKGVPTIPISWLFTMNLISKWASIKDASKFFAFYFPRLHPYIPISATFS